MTFTVDWEKTRTRCTTVYEKRLPSFWIKPFLPLDEIHTAVGYLPIMWVQVSDASVFCGGLDCALQVRP
jgi:hypothetical protein